MTIIKVDARGQVLIARLGRGTPSTINNTNK